jgi:SWI/SNF-related matrix-associated actin-dependent regulator 1 of chromatin subfamily A
MRLTFRNGKFELQGFGIPKLDDRWQTIDCTSKCSTHVGAALQFRRVADHVAEKVFNRILVKSYPALTYELPSFLDPHQRAGVEWVLTRSRSYLAHAPGAGKTIEAIVASYLSLDKDHLQNLYIVPPSLTANWSREIFKALDLLGSGTWPGVTVVPRSDKKESTGWNANFLIVPDSMLTKPWVLPELIKRRKKFAVVAVDEASRFKDPTALRSVALFGGKKGSVHSPGLLQDAKHAVLMDGSPMPNRPMELWGPTYAMAPETIDFMSERDFGFKYCGAIMNDWGEWEFRNSSHEAELRAKLQKSFMHVVTEDELSHPERRRRIVVMTDDPRSREFKEWERRWLRSVDLDDVDEDSNRGELAERRLELGLEKVEFIASFARERAEKDESILLFAWHREVCQRLAERLKDLRPALVQGGTKDSVRETWFEKFQSKSCKLIIGNIAAMGRGHNLQAADRVIFGEYSWTDELNKQCEKRASRRGSIKRFVPCDYIVAPNSMDEMILSSVFTKARRVKKVIG